MKRLARRWWRMTVGALLVLYALPGLAARCAGLRASTGYAPRAVLVLRPGLLGDGVLLTPALALARRRWPAAQIHVLATPIQRAVFDGLPGVDRVIVWDAGDLLEPRLALQPRRWAQATRTVAALRRERYDLALCCYSALASAVALLAGARERVGFAGEALPGTLTHALTGRRYDRPVHDAEYSLEVVRAAPGAAESQAADGAASPRTTLPPSLPDLDGARRLLGRGAPGAGGDGAVGSSRDRRLVALHTGATNGEAKRWPPEYWARLAGRVVSDSDDVVLVGAGARDERLAGQIVRAVANGTSDTSKLPAGQNHETGTLPGERGSVVNLVGRTTLGELCGVLALADAVVSGDSGPMHLAAALRRPLVTIFGPTDPAASGPFRAEQARVVRHPLPCMPCYRLERVADCPLGHTLCQWLVQPDEVYAALADVLGVAPPSPGPSGAAWTGMVAAPARG